jgi:integrase
MPPFFSVPAPNARTNQGFFSTLLDAGWLVILGDGKTRTEQERLTVTPADDKTLCAVAALDKWAAAHKWAEGSLVFRSLKNRTNRDDSDERPLALETANTDLRAAFEAAGLPAALLGTHSARRGFAIIARRHAGLDPIALARAGRWKTISTAQRYAEEADGRASAKARNQRLTRPR